MRQRVKKVILTHTLVSVLSVISSGLFIGAWFWAYKTLASSTQTLILHFNNLKRINYTGDFTELYGYFFFTLVCLVANITLAYRLDFREGGWGKPLAIINLFWVILIFIGITAIIRVN